MLYISSLAKRAVFLVSFGNATAKGVFVIQSYLVVLHHPSVEKKQVQSRNEMFSPQKKIQQKLHAFLKQDLFKQ